MLLGKGGKELTKKRAFGSVPTFAVATAFHSFSEVLAQLQYLPVIKTLCDVFDRLKYIVCHIVRKK